MLLHKLKKSKAYKNSKPRLGRGNACGKGNYSTKGMKGQRARSGGAKPIWFEGGQTPLTRRIPKLKGFKRYYKLVTNYEVVNLSSLNSFDEGTVVTKDLLEEVNLISSKLVNVKVLGKGKLEKKLTFEGIESFSANAQDQIKKVGGEIK